MSIQSRTLAVRPFARRRADIFGCPCCAPALKTLGQLSLFSMESAGKASAWSRFPAPPSPEVRARIWTNASILTVDAAFSRAEALAVRGDRILAVGDLATVRAAAGEDAEVIDAGGRAILPGFIEPHMHFFSVAILGRLPDLGPFVCDDAAAVLARVADLARQTLPGEWIVARQLDPSLQAGVDGIDRHSLDTAAPTHPVFIFNASLHIAYCNSAALEIAGVGPATADPPGAAFARDADGRPNGVLKGQPAMFSVLGHNLRAMALEDVPQACLDVCAKANRVGITTLCDQAAGGFQGRRELDAFHAFAESGRMTARLRYSLIQAGAAAWDEQGLKPGRGDAMARSIGWKIVSDGSNQGRTGLQRQAYLDGQGGTGIAYVEPEALKQIVIQRALQGWQVVVHANGDLAIDRALDAFEAAYAAGAPRDLRFRIEHCSVLHDAQIARMANLGISPSFLIGHVHYWGKAFRDEIFGPEKADLLCRAASCGRAGLRWSLHSDDTVTEMDPLRLIDNAVNRRLWRAPDETLNPAERVTVEAAIVALTRDAAWQCHSEHEIGTLEAGKFADFVVLDRDPLAVAPEDIRSLKVLETWVGGRCVHAA